MSVCTDRSKRNEKGWCVRTDTHHEYFVQLVDFGVSGEEGAFVGHLYGLDNMYGSVWGVRIVEEGRASLGV